MIQPKISFLVPYRNISREREENWRWLKRYWTTEMPEAEIVMGTSYQQIFSKTEAINDAARRATGDIFVLLDSDCYIDANVIRRCVAQIIDAENHGEHLWMIPYRNLYRLTKEASKAIRQSDPHDPLRLSSPPGELEYDSTDGSAGIGRGHWFGAMIQIMPSDAYWTVGGMDPRFSGWGGEDIAFVRAVDTLWGKHKSAAGDVLHLWHARIGSTYDTRMWKGQLKPQGNGHLSMRYARATGDRLRMRHLVTEGASLEKHRWWVPLLRRLPSWVPLPWR